MQLEFKIPNWLFILIVAIIAFVLLYNIFMCNDKEGYVNFEQGAESLNQSINVPMADSTTPSAIKLYDNIFIYPNSGKVVRAYDSGLTGASLESITVYSRIDGNGQDMEYNENTTFNAGGITPPYYQQWDSGVSNANYLAATNTEFNYFGNGKDTYIHILDRNITKTNANHFGYYLSTDGENISFDNNTFMDVSFVESATQFSPTFVEDVSFSTSNGTNINITESKIYKMSENVFFNTRNGDLYIKDVSGVDMFSRRGTTINNISGNGVEITNEYIGLMKKDNLGGNLVIYIANKGNTMIALLKKNDPANTETQLYTTGSAVRFDSNGDIINSIATDPNINQDEGNNNEGTEETEETEETEPDSSNNMPPGFPPGMFGPGMPPHGNIPNNNISDYYKWYWFWNTSGSMPVNFSEDYMLKTQVVPPVCPACPSCPKHEGCSNCGGTGGNGTVDASGNSLVAANSGSGAVNNLVSTTGNVATDVIDAGSGALNKTLDTSTDLLKSAGSGTTNLIGDTLGLAASGVSGAAGMARDTVSGAAGMARDTVTGSVDLAKETVQGGVDVARDFGEGTYDVINKGMDERDNRGYGGYNRGYGGYNGYNGGYNSGGYNNSGGARNMGYNGMGSGPMNPYTYNGKLQEKPESNFLPRTNDFSAFSK